MLTLALHLPRGRAEPVAEETLEAVLAVDRVTDQTELLILAAEAVRKNLQTLQLVGLAVVARA
jgi:hypothetical protein